MASYDKPTLFIHGDTHIFHVSKPLVDRKKLDASSINFTRLEVFGDPDSHWVRVMVDPKDPGSVHDPARDHSGEPGALAHVPEKWVPVFRQGHAPT